MAHPSLGKQFPWAKPVPFSRSVNLQVANSETHNGVRRVPRNDGGVLTLHIRQGVSARLPGAGTRFPRGSFQRYGIVRERATTPQQIDGDYSQLTE